VALRLALSQCNPTVGDLNGNTELVLQAAQRAAAEKADILVLPEQVLTGYPIEDLALRRSFQDAARAALHTLASSLDGVGDLVTIVGTLDFRETASGERTPINTAAVIWHGQVIGTYVKHHLPNYGVFDEARYFAPGDAPLFLDLPQGRIALAICEDLWQDGGPVQWARSNNAQALIVLNASPYERSKDDARLALCQQRAREAGCPLAYVNLVGGQDELVFDGDSLVVDTDGALLARARQFVDEDIVIDLALTPAQHAPSAYAIDVELPHLNRTPLDPPRIATPLSDEAEVYGALVTGLRDYVRKNGFDSVLLGLSGGIDSALVAAIACDALGSDHVFGVAMPSKYSSEHSIADAYDLAERTGLSVRTVPIAPMVDAYMHSIDLTGLAEENLQARVRGTTLMAISNQEGHLVLATGNKSEISVGYSTMYGDAVGGFAPIKDVPKVLVWALARWRNDQPGTSPIPPNSIDKPPSAELRPDQLDSDSLPDYHELDALLAAYVDADMGYAALLDAGFDEALATRVIHLTDTAEYKRRQYPPGTKISLRAFGRDRRLPITNRWRERS
jgi:NAD+ synthase (glutamine-hydrolysing)